MFIGFCEFCHKVLEDDKPVPERKPIESIEELVEYFHPTPHYICGDCFKKLMNKKEE